MFIPRLPHLLALLLCAALLAACTGAPSAAAPAVSPPTAVSQATRLPATGAPAPTSAPATIAPAPTDVPATSAPAPTGEPSPTAGNPTADPITGAAAFARGTITKRPIIVMIDNHPDAYPQTGLDKASVVFEALAEYGVTRFMALYAPGVSPEAAQIGPVRSTRLYFVHWAMGFQAVYAHAGGSPQGLALAQSTDQILNLDALRSNAGAYFARSSARFAPHNLYTSSAKLEKAAADFKSTDINDPELGFLFKTDAPQDQRATLSPLSYYFIYPQDPAGWTYDAATNGYLRLRRGKAARDAASGQQLWAKNVLVMEVTERPIAGDEKGRIEQDVIGTGAAKLFQDGTEQDVTWRKPSPSAPLRFYTAGGDEVRFNAGPVWIVAVPSMEHLTVK